MTLTLKCDNIFKNIYDIKYVVVVAIAIGFILLKITEHAFSSKLFDYNKNTIKLYINII